jgi:hypothetical protein
MARGSGKQPAGGSEGRKRIPNQNPRKNACNKMHSILYMGLTCDELASPGQTQSVNKIQTQ